jgi:hypothetical protein
LRGGGLDRLRDAFDWPIGQFLCLLAAHSHDAGKGGKPTDIATYCGSADRTVRRGIRFRSRQRIGSLQDVMSTAVMPMMPATRLAGGRQREGRYERPNQHPRLQAELGHRGAPLG